MRNKITQKEAIFFTLYENFKSGLHEYIPVFRFMGEVYVPKLDKWGYVSHECSARCSGLRKENPELIQHTLLTGKSGAHYYGYRLNPQANPSMLNDDSLKKFWKSIYFEPK